MWQGVCHISQLQYYFLCPSSQMYPSREEFPAQTSLPTYTELVLLGFKVLNHQITFLCCPLLPLEETFSSSIQKPHCPRTAVCFLKPYFRSCELTSDLYQLSQNVVTRQQGLQACHWFSSLKVATINAITANPIFLLDSALSSMNRRIHSFGYKKKSLCLQLWFLKQNFDI